MRLRTFVCADAGFASIRVFRSAILVSRRNSDIENLLPREGGGLLPRHFATGEYPCVR
ncbi:hypothetical protein BQ8482_90280 [Mesorhizobium delmotii]|uniref:Uncharacterized protein n=1 Tax=Mesorhizobium delmotii TaxID=1631247 RepID=A0A2P9AXT2_9HYPH|nr:hypothetical protein BQ8482_90280 [Mesorhizobium delmotii]